MTGATEHLKGGKSGWRCARRVKYTPDFRDLVYEIKKANLINFYIGYMLKWSHLGCVSLHFFIWPSEKFKSHLWLMHNFKLDSAGPELWQIRCQDEIMQRKRSNPPFWMISMAPARSGNPQLPVIWSHMNRPQRSHPPIYDHLSEKVVKWLECKEMWWGPWPLWQCLLPAGLVKSLSDLSEQWLWALKLKTAANAWTLAQATPSVLNFLLLPSNFFVDWLLKTLGSPYAFCLSLIGQSSFGLLTQFLPC